MHGYEAVPFTIPGNQSIETCDIVRSTVKKKKGRGKATTRDAVMRLFYLTESVYNVVLPKSFPAQIRQLILDISNNEG